MWQQVLQFIDLIKEKLKSWLSSFSLSDDQDDQVLSQRLKWLAASFATLFIVALIWGMYISAEPKAFSVRAEVLNEPAAADQAPIIGVATTSTLVKVVETMLEKPGGYLSNDVTPPGVWLDNIPNWEYGAIVQVRDLSKALREAYSRSQSQSLEDPKLASAESRFNFNHRSWILPRTETQYREGVEFLQDYLSRLSDVNEQQAQFYARADNLNYWLKTVETRLGNLSQKLSASVGQRRINTDLAGDNAANQSTATPSEINVKTPWFEIDDVFYEARGSTWALMHFLQAVEVDFAEVLDKKNARVSLRQIIRELEGAQQSVASPIILNGSGFGIFANHSLVMANYISRANAAIIDLRELLAQG